MGRKIRVVVEMADGKVIGARSNRAEVEIAMVDYDKTGFSFEDQDCDIALHTADEDAEGVQAIFETLDPNDEETD